MVWRRKSGDSIRDVAKLSGVSPTTVHKVRKALERVNAERREML